MNKETIEKTAKRMFREIRPVWVKRSGGTFLKDWKKMPEVTKIGWLATAEWHLKQIAKMRSK